MELLSSRLAIITYFLCGPFFMSYFPGSDIRELLCTNRISNRSAKAEVGVL